MGVKDQLIAENGVSAGRQEEKKNMNPSVRLSAVKRWYKAATSHVGLFVALIVYTALGGLIFRHLEYPDELSRLRQLESQVREERRWLLWDMYNGSLSYIQYDQALARYEVVVQEVAKGGVQLPLSDTTHIHSLARWSYLQAVFFASTVLTTIGYGNITPSTMEGRLFCMMYALVGIPLTLSVLADLGSLLASSLPSMPEASGLKRSLASAALATSILLVYIAIGSIVFISWEKEWTFFDGFYFCFVTMTTIGFGDLVPSTPQYMLLCTLYILLGLSLTSTIIELVRQQYSQSWRHLQALAETLGRMADQRSDVQSDLRRIITVVNFTRDKKPKDWEQAVQQLAEELHKHSVKPQVVQVIFYESSV
ncbi:TWiK family of potassium channels protein 7-like [Macrosteles quadrilineatus]|uniref:TWiK family of potassium channels protein 7-like n=1 Tax=Macrosteles quadrilineatus TaxID=74068 RepID=UPI0023E0933E|nr:TWiK family of potassium channels protein 7-like [Macrosteles quadrilineatus]